MSAPNTWAVQSTGGSGEPDRVVNMDTGQEGRAYFGMGGPVGDVRDPEGNDIGSIDTSGD
jgi:hypothetical protein